MKKRRLYLIAVCAILTIFLWGCGTESVPKYNLGVFAEPEEGGMVTPEGGEFTEGRTVELTAIPNEGWLFTRWEGNLTGNNNPGTLRIESNSWVRAVFEKRTYPLTLTVEGNGRILEEVIQEKAVEHSHGTVVKLQPAPDSGWRFSHWGGGLLSGNETPVEILIDKPVNVTATFVPLAGSIRTFGGSSYDITFSMTETTDGGFAVTGYTSSNDGDFEGQHLEDVDLFVIKVGTDGFKEWSRLFGDKNLNHGYSITNTMDGGIVVSGKAQADSWETLVIKLDNNGNMLWERAFYMGSGEALTATKDGGVVVTGFSHSDEGIFEGLNRGESDVYLLKLSATGDVEWVQSFGGSSGEVGRSVVQTADGGFLLSGWAYSTDGTFEGLKDHSNIDAFLIRTNSEGEVQWAKFLHDRNEQHSLRTESPDVVETVDGRFIYTYTDCKGGPTLGSSICRYHLVELDRDGEVLWRKTFSGSESDGIDGITATNDGGVIMTGYTSSDDGDFAGLTKKGFTDILIHKLTASGDTEWIKNYGGSRWQSGRSIIQTGNGGFALTGSFMSNDGDFEGMLRDGADIFIMKTDASGELLSEW